MKAKKKTAAKGRSLLRRILFEKTRKSGGGGFREKKVPAHRWAPERSRTHTKRDQKKKKVVEGCQRDAWRKKKTLPRPEWEQAIMPTFAASRKKEKKGGGG